MSASWKRNWIVIGFIFLNMAILGIVQAARGPVLPFIEAEYRLSYSSLALILAVCAIGLLLGVSIGGRICERFGYRKGLLFATAILFTSLGILGTHSSFESLLVNFFFIYLALGCIDISINSLASTIFVTKTAILMSVTHFFFGLGSAGGSQYAGFMLAGEIPWRHIFISVLVLCAISLIMVFLAKFPDAKQKDSGKGLRFAEVIKDMRVWLLFGTIGLCVMFDFGVTSWLVLYLRNSQNMTPDASASYLALYFLLFALGRLFGGVIAEKLGYIKTFLVCIIGAIVFFSLGIILNHAFLFAIIGLFTSVFFPLFLSIVVKEFQDNAPAVIHVIFPLNNILFMASSALLGILMDNIGVQAGFYMIGLFIAIAPVCLFFLKKSLKHKV